MKNKCKKCVYYNAYKAKRIPVDFSCADCVKFVLSDKNTSKENNANKRVISDLNGINMNLIQQRYKT